MANNSTDDVNEAAIDESHVRTEKSPLNPPLSIRSRFPTAVRTNLGRAWETGKSRAQLVPSLGMAAAVAVMAAAVAA